MNGIKTSTRTHARTHTLLSPVLYKNYFLMKTFILIQQFFCFFHTGARNVIAGFLWPLTCDLRMRVSFVDRKKARKGGKQCNGDCRAKCEWQESLCSEALPSRFHLYLHSTEIHIRLNVHCMFLVLIIQTSCLLDHWYQFMSSSLLYVCFLCIYIVRNREGGGEKML